MSRACVCGGSNENCRFCGGLGTVPDTLATALDDRVQRMAVAQTSLRSPQPRRGLTSHRIQIHRRNPPARAIGVRTKRKSVRPAANLIRCPEGCGAFLNPRNVKRHLSKVHGEGFPLDRMKIRVPQPPLPADETEHKHESCPVCDASVRTDQLPAHIAKAHKHPPENSLIPRLLHAPTSNIYSGARLPRSAAPAVRTRPSARKYIKYVPFVMHVLEARNSRSTWRGFTRSANTWDREVPAPKRS